MFETGDWGGSDQKQDHLIYGLFGEISANENEAAAAIKSKEKSEESAENTRKKRKHRGNTKRKKTLGTDSLANSDSILSNIEADSEAVGLGKTKNNKRIKQGDNESNTKMGHQVMSEKPPKAIKGESYKKDEYELKSGNSQSHKKTRKKKKKSSNEEEGLKAQTDENQAKELTKDDVLTRPNSYYDTLPPVQPVKKASLGEKMKSKLESSRFRWINEQLYTTSGDHALTMFSAEPALFDVYHRGFRTQVEHWPVNPVNVIIQWLLERPVSLIVADFGCGDALIAQTVPNKVPLDSSSVDVAIFCLSLMGTDLQNYLLEAHRVLKKGGILKVAEVVSRVDPEAFVDSLSQLGFRLESRDESNKMFILMDFTKVKRKMPDCAELLGLKLKPCIYKKR
ncbi:ribosomal RNA-processing protein 8 isoform X2 [Nematostella vectensis]|uniref:ribosomal RNA-processing protein 8 isoform X2 n=1 Tax=Nematostella vectensis TaxID=45351 RepID=UPI001390433F|nr:ribosomal RNA-processing protein 8 isoform X2 [Nematostella vectensis]